MESCNLTLSWSMCQLIDIKDLMPHPSDHSQNKILQMTQTLKSG